MVKSTIPTPVRIYAPSDESPFADSPHPLVTVCNEVVRSAEPAIVKAICLYVASLCDYQYDGRIHFTREFFWSIERSFCNEASQFQIRQFLHQTLSPFYELTCDEDLVFHAESSKRQRRPLSASKSLKVFARDAYQCAFCGDKSDLTVDHILPVSRGGTNDLDNLRTLCRSCNSRKGAK